MGEAIEGHRLDKNEQSSRYLCDMVDLVFPDEAVFDLYANFFDLLNYGDLVINETEVGGFGISFTCTQCNWRVVMDSCSWFSVCLGG